MKYLLVFLLMVLVGWRWRYIREVQRADMAHKKATARRLPVDIIKCGHCGVHIPRVDAIQGQRTMYCTQHHCSLAES